ncbi:carbohydrate kinase family protein [Paenibacillus ihumii]|uniref:carbohydrate kinase family protein n=1 Tax=Paenibacillus ihumii TaxID=687436 RepID=UPI0006D7A5E2|nr:carbohydrate kinase family protein [Paenibacillus ihumii]
MITVIGDLVSDIIVHRDMMNYGTDTDASIRLHCGGQGNNVAAWIAHEGVECQLIGRVGDDPFGLHLLARARKYGIRCEVQADPLHPTGKIIVMIDNDTGERSMIVDRGANLELGSEDIVNVEQSKLLYLSGYSLFADKPRQAITHAKGIALSQGIPIALDPSSTYNLRDHKEVLFDFLDGITFLFPNLEEGMYLTGEIEPTRILMKLAELVPNPILKMGEGGCLFLEGQTIVHLKPPQVKAIDVTGAGDSFIGSFLAKYYRTQDIRKSAQRAIEVSSKVVTQNGSMPHLPE